MSWYLIAWQKYFTFSGRARRKEYWYFTLFYSVGAALAVVLDMLLGTFDPQVSLGWLTVCYLLASLPPLLAVSARRLHDIGRSGWWLWLNLLPGFGSVTLSVIALFDSQPGANAFGPNPKDPAEENEPLDFHSGKRQRKNGAHRAGKAAAIAMALAGLVIGAGWVWWQQNATELMAEAKAMRDKGLATGRTLDERACVALAVEALGARAGSSFVAGIANAVELAGCLEASRATPGFCDGVPAHTDPFATGQWIASVCSHMGHQGNTACNTMVQRISDYCVADKRSQKLGSTAAGNT